MTQSIPASDKQVKHAFAYVRVSVDEEDGNNASIESQKVQLRQYAAKNGMEIVAFFEEPDVSGRKESRIQFNRMMDLALGDDHPVDFVLAYNLNRFARRLMTQVNADYALMKADVELITIWEGVADDPNSKFMRNVIGAMNEKYSVDASQHTRRDRRYNATQGFWNGGPVPFGYKSVIARTDGRKERKKLALCEEEAAVVELVYQLALTGIDGQPMGTRAIAAHLNREGYTLRGKPFRHSSVDGILTREHYTGTYHDRTCPIVDKKARAEDAIAVQCPKIIEPQVAAAVAARRAKAAPTVTPPRVTNSPVLLTGICTCGAPKCGSGLTIRTGKGGRYAYYTCNRRAEAAAACRAKPVRAEELDKVVVDALLDRLLRPERLGALLEDVLDLSDAADEKRQADRDRVRRERVEAEKKLRNLLVLGAESGISAKDKVFSGCLAEYRSSIAILGEREKILARTLSASANRITEESIRRFAGAIQRSMSENTAMRKAYVRLLVDQVTVNDETIVISGSKAALEAAVGSDFATDGAVPSFDREWCRLQDSNL